MLVCRGSLSICVGGSFPFGFEGRMWDLIVLVPEQCPSFYFVIQIRSCRVQGKTLLQLSRSFHSWDIAEQISK